MKIRKNGAVLLLLVLWGTVAASAQTYYFTTIAGQPGVSGTSDGTNNVARFNRPAELVLDPSGALYVTEVYNNAIRKLTPVGNDWVVTTVAGLPGVMGSQDGTNSEARFNSPNGIARDQQGNLYVADHNNHILRRIALDGTNAVVTTIAGLAGSPGIADGTNADARFRIPTGIAVDAAGRVFDSDTSSCTIRMTTPVGGDWVVTTIAGIPGSLDTFLDGLNQAAAFSFPYGIAFGPDGALYVSDAGNDAIRRLTAVSGGWYTATIANYDGISGTNDGPAWKATFYTPNGITLDSATNIYVADQWNHTLRKLTYSRGDWTVSTIGGQPRVYGSADGFGPNTSFWRPWGVAVAPSGALFVADTYNHTIRRGVPVVVLQLATTTSGMVLSWPVAAGGFQLEMTSELSAGAVWEAVTNGISVSGDSYVFTNAMTASAAFFRLRR